MKSISPHELTWVVNNNETLDRDLPFFIIANAEFMSSSLAVLAKLLQFTTALTDPLIIKNLILKIFVYILVNCFLLFHYNEFQQVL